MILDKQILEEALVTSPFDHALRLKYLRVLVNLKLVEEASIQLEILMQQVKNNTELTDLRLALEVIRGELNIIDRDIGSESKKVSHLNVISGGANEKDKIVSIMSHRTVRFADIVGMQSVKKIVKRKIIDPFRNQSLFAKFQKKSGGGILLYGPPGCGKTMIAKAIATECDATFFAVGISDILNMYIGQSENQLASVFDRARSSKPAVLFFDELDALAYSRSKANSDYTRTLVNEFLNQLDGAETKNEGVLILGATNMPWDVDDAMKRPGRFDKQVFVPPLDLEARAELLRNKLVEIPCGEIDVMSIGKLCEHYSGADMDALIEVAKDLVLDDIMAGEPERGIEQKDFVEALSEIEPSTLDWLKTARNLVKFGNAGGTYKEVEKYLRSQKLY